MITELTDEQKALFEPIVKKWTTIAPLDRVKATEYCQYVMKLADLPIVPVFFVKSPVAAQYLGTYLIADKPLIPQEILDEMSLEDLRKTTPDPNARTSFGSYVGVKDYGWLAFYDYFKEIGVLDHEEFERYKKSLETGIWDTIQLDGAWVVCEAPVETHLIDKDVLHKDGAPAVLWRDGYCQYWLNGISVPDWLVMTPETSLNLGDYNRLDGADVKMEFVRKFGVDRMVSKGKLIDTYKNYPENAWYNKSQYQLYDMACLFRGVEYAPHLLMKHQTMGIMALEGVSPSVRTIPQALEDRVEEDMSGHEIDDIK